MQRSQWMLWLLFTTVFAPSIHAGVQIPIRDAELTRIATGYFPIDVVLEEARYTLSKPQVQNGSEGESQLSVQLSIAHVPVGQAIFRTVLGLDQITNELTAPDLRIERIIPQPQMTNSAEIARQRIHRWISANDGTLRWPLPDHPLVKNTWFALGNLQAVRGALILTFQ